MDAAVDGQQREGSSLGHDVIARGQAVRRKMALIEAKDGSGNSCISEAANSGAVDVIKLLLETGADVNSRYHIIRPFLRNLFVCVNRSMVLKVLGDRKRLARTGISHSTLVFIYMETNSMSANQAQT